MKHIILYLAILALLLAGCTPATGPAPAEPPAAEAPPEPEKPKSAIERVQMEQEPLTTSVSRFFRSIYTKGTLPAMYKEYVHFKIDKRSWPYKEFFTGLDQTVAVQYNMVDGMQDIDQQTHINTLLKEKMIAFLEAPPPLEPGLYREWMQATEIRHEYAYMNCRAIGSALFVNRSKHTRYQIGEETRYFDEQSRIVLDLATGEEIKLVDLFANNADFENILLEAVAKVQKRSATNTLEEVGFVSQDTAILQPLPLDGLGADLEFTISGVFLELTMAGSDYTLLNKHGIGRYISIPLVDLGEKFVFFQRFAKPNLFTEESPYELHRIMTPLEVERLIVGATVKKGDGMNYTGGIYEQVKTLENEELRLRLNALLLPTEEERALLAAVKNSEFGSNAVRFGNYIGIGVGISAIDGDVKLPPYRQYLFRVNTGEEVTLENLCQRPIGMGDLDNLLSREVSDYQRFLQAYIENPEGVHLLLGTGGVTLRITNGEEGAYASISYLDLEKYGLSIQ